MSNCLWLADIKGKKRNKVGGKALRLAELKKGGFEVPKAFCIVTNVFDQFLVDNKLIPQLGLLRLDRDKSVLKSICRRIREEIGQGKIDSQIRGEVLKNLRKIETNRFAIRSSANCEDLQLSSFAGQFESYLDILTDQVFVAIRKCWVSVFSRRVLTYTLFHEIELRKIKMAVLVQEMIKSDKGGVLFTKNILDGNIDKMVIEATKGLVDDVVLGLVEPERVVVNKKSKEVESWEMPNGKVLSQKEVKRLMKIAMEVEDFYQGVPQDIEWVMRKGKIYLLQSRPITA